MIISEKLVSFLEFKKLMGQLDEALNQDAMVRPDFYKSHGGSQLERPVYEQLNRLAMGTAFEGSIKLVSGARFPDIVAKGLYGVEVKSTQADSWTSTGSSILETTRVEGVKYIYLTFGKLGGQPAFMSRPYEECLNEIAVTHYPRYRIDMNTADGETIFDKIGVSYEDLRQMQEPTRIVSNYYKRQLKPGESLWWAGDYESQSAPMVIRMWNNLSVEERHHYMSMGYAFFPEMVASSNPKKYNAFALWMASQGVVCSNVRDIFSAGGQIVLEVEGQSTKAPQVFGRIRTYSYMIRKVLYEADCEELATHWRETVTEDRSHQWMELVASRGSGGDVYNYQYIFKLIKSVF